MDLTVRNRWNVYKPRDRPANLDENEPPKNRSKPNNHRNQNAPNFTNIFNQNQTDNHPQTYQEDISRHPAQNYNPNPQHYQNISNSSYPNYFQPTKGQIMYKHTENPGPEEHNIVPFGELSGNNYEENNSRYVNYGKISRNPSEFEHEEIHQFEVLRNNQYEEETIYVGGQISEENFNPESTELDKDDLEERIDEIKQKTIPISKKAEEFKAVNKMRMTKSKDVKRKNISFLKKFYNKAKAVKLWKESLNEIEFNFGSGIKGYFDFIKWLMTLNVLGFLLTFFLIILPMILNGREDTVCNVEENFSDCCTEKYFNLTYKNNHIFDFIQGTGFMEKTLLFQGYYSNKVFNTPLPYNLPLAYILVNFFILFICFVLTVIDATKYVKVETDFQNLRFSNLFFNWSFAINNEKKAKLKHNEIAKEIKIIFDFEQKEKERAEKVENKKRVIIAIRVVANCVVLAILAASAYGIYSAFNLSNRILTENGKFNNLLELSNYVSVFYQFLPSLSITLLNIVVPTVFSIIVNLETYSHDYAVKVTLIRMVLLRMFSICVLYASVYGKISCEVPEGECRSEDCEVTCWETFIGQQIYKLVMMEFGVLLVMTFIVNFGRSKIGKFDNKFAKIIGEQNFDLSKHVLDIIYYQTICWFGSYYVPFLSGMFSLIFFFMFYIKKFTCLVNCKPSYYYIPHSKAMFMRVLLVSFLFAFVPLALSFAELTPSLSCGPFRGNTNAWNVVTDAVTNAPNWVEHLFNLLTSIHFQLIVFVILCLLLYYYLQMISTNNSIIKVLKKQYKESTIDNQKLGRSIYNR